LPDSSKNRVARTFNIRTRCDFLSLADKSLGLAALSSASAYAQRLIGFAG